MPVALQVLATLVILVLASDAFTNAVEWIGARFGLTRSAAGAIVAAIGSSLPETMVAFVALVVLGGAASEAVGIGAVIGAPLLLSTLVFGLIGIGALAFGKTRNAIAAPAQPTIFGLVLFACTFVLVIGASFAPSRALHIAVAALVVGAYVVYLVYHMRLQSPESDEAPPRLRIAPLLRRPGMVLIGVQFLAAAVITVFAAQWFVGSVTALAASIMVSPLIVSLILSPIATELPEVLNVLIWTRRDLEDLALGNVIGAMMFQTSITSAIALVASHWQLDASSYRAAAATLAAVLLVLLWTVVRRRVEALPFALCVLFYGAYLVAEFVRP